MLLPLANVATGTGSSSTCLLPCVIKAIQKITSWTGLVPLYRQVGRPNMDCAGHMEVDVYLQTFCLDEAHPQHGNTPYPKLLRFSL